HNNTAIGSGALASSTGNANMALGMWAGSQQNTGSANVYVHAPGVAGENGTIRIGSSAPFGPKSEMPAQTRTFIAGIKDFALTGVPVVIDQQGQLGVQGSSLRYKDNIRDMGEASRNLQKLRPVTFTYNAAVAGVGEQRTRAFGLIAEEVAEVYPELV